MLRPSSPGTDTEPVSNVDHLELLSDMKSVLEADALDWWLFGGWGLDAQLGRVTRDHSDIEC